MSQYSLATWRLLIMPSADGATNMAVDEAILHALADGVVVRPTVRFYQWDPPCLSLGYNQCYSDVDESACARLGYGWVRRPTGGRAILHTDELTYSVVVPADEPRVAGGITDSYRRLSVGLLAGLRALGTNVFQSLEDNGSNSQPGAVCFDTPSKYEITVRDKKLIGSAQVRRRGIVLQHGTLPLTGDLSRILDCLRTAEPIPAGPPPNRTNHPGRPEVAVQKPEALASRSDWLLARACTLKQALGREVSFHEAANALAQGLASELNLRLEPDVLTDREHLLTDQLRRDQYASDDWNRRI